ncbi:hypothetical protein EDB85DRAFT_2275661 [Lactarius pseudohatsudake]|nr:hypothetical protein EDB85DRAFT_2275661 [Lactarius pseudohatsudake]
MGGRFLVQRRVPGYDATAVGVNGKGKMRYATPLKVPMDSIPASFDLKFLYLISKCQANDFHARVTPTLLDILNTETLLPFNRWKLLSSIECGDCDDEHDRERLVCTRQLTGNGRFANQTRLGKVVLITGISRGIGQKTAITYIMWNQRDVHEKREARNHRIEQLGAEVACNDVLLARLRVLQPKLAQSGSPYISSEVDRLRTNSSPEAPPTNVAKPVPYDPPKHRKRRDGELSDPTTLSDPIDTYYSTVRNTLAAIFAADVSTCVRSIPLPISPSETPSAEGTEVSPPPTAPEPPGWPFQGRLGDLRPVATQLVESMDSEQPL